MINEILTYLPAECPWRDTLHWFTTVDSTSDYAKTLARTGAPQGTAVIAERQTKGRGRMGRSFFSNEGGIYLSVILRPECPATELMHLTCAAGVCVCDAIQAATGFRPGIKWINDLVADRKKLGGILTELSTNPENGSVDFAVIGIGINSSTRKFPTELQEIATSLEAVTGKPVDLPKLTGYILCALWKMSENLNDPDYLTRYGSDCITLGQEISLIRGNEIRHGKALALNPDGSLLVAFSDGTQSAVQSGEVSIRGMYGYI